MNEVLKRARAAYGTGAYDDTTIEFLFPEVKESVDERIRKSLVKYFKQFNLEDMWNEEFSFKDILAYLEKQKEQKPVDNVSKEEYVKRFKVLCDAYEIRLPNREYDIYHLCDDLSKLSIASGKQKPAEWSEEDERMLSRCVKSIECSKDFCVTETFLKAKDKEKDWLKSLPERFNLQPKQEWSEEDEEHLDSIIESYKELLKDYSANHGIDYIPYNTPVVARTVLNDIKFLKSFRSHPKQETHDYFTPHKEFFQWIYDRLVHVHKENPDVDYMRSFKDRINNLSFEEN